MEYLQIVVSTTHEFADIVAMCLMENGSEGVNVSDYNDICETLNAHSWDYVDDSLTVNEFAPVLVSGYFDKDFNVAQLQEAICVYANMAECETGSLEISVTEINSKDWEEEWKKYYAPIEIGKVVIVPKWIKYNKKNVCKVLLDPGMAFGTGNHETTALCIELMQQFDLRDKSVLDVGCGSGILGITALSLGANACHFSDIDAQAIKATNENLKLNGKIDKATVYCGNLLDGFASTADCVFANITADVLLLLLPDVEKVLKRGAGLVISGLINDRADEVINAYATKFSLKTRICKGEWQGASFINDKN